MTREGSAPRCAADRFVVPDDDDAAGGGPLPDGRRVGGFLARRRRATDDDDPVADPGGFHGGPRAGDGQEAGISVRPVRSPVKGPLARVKEFVASKSGTPQEEYERSVGRELDDSSSSGRVAQSCATFSPPGAAKRQTRPERNLPHQSRRGSSPPDGRSGRSPGLPEGRRIAPEGPPGRRRRRPGPRRSGGDGRAG